MASCTSSGSIDKVKKATKNISKQKQSKSSIANASALITRKLILENQTMSPVICFSGTNLGEQTGDDGEDKIKLLKPKVKFNPMQTMPWVEKYRPRRLDTLVIDPITKKKLQKIIDDREMPNMIITGSPGIGKTSTIMCVARALLGHHINDGLLELNASDDRGIKTVQDSIIYFCKKTFRISDETNHKYSKQKLIILDEADNMTTKAQQLINTLMESYNKTTRFAFTCNNSSEIVEAIQSRCIILRYMRLSNEQVILRLEEICKAENVIFNNDGLKTIIATSCGDLRQAINNLQLTHAGFGEITETNVYKLCDQPHPNILRNIFILCSQKDIVRALKLLETLRQKGYNSSDIIMSMIGTFKTMLIPELNENIKMRFLLEINKTAHIISRGLDTPTQLTGCIANLCFI